MTIKEALEHLDAARFEWNEDYAYQKPRFEALDMAIDALRAQQPRVLTLEELKSYDRETIWFQVKSNHTMKQLTQDGIAALIFIGLLYDWDGYGTVWRCWTTRPTDEQREAIPWNAQN